MKNNSTIISFVIVAAAITAFIFLINRDVPAPQAEMVPDMNPSYVFMCEDGRSIMATFHLPEDGTVDIGLSDGRTMILSHVMSGSGARYANADESFVFWNKGVSAIIEEGGVTTYENCSADLGDIEQ